MNMLAYPCLRSLLVSMTVDALRFICYVRCVHHNTFRFMVCSGPHSGQVHLHCLFQAQRCLISRRCHANLQEIWLCSVP